MRVCLCCLLGVYKLVHKKHGNTLLQTSLLHTTHLSIYLSPSHPLSFLLFFSPVFTLIYHFLSSPSPSPSLPLPLFPSTSMRFFLALVAVALCASTVLATAPLDCLNSQLNTYTYASIGTWNLHQSSDGTNDTCVCYEWEDPPDETNDCSQWKFTADSFEDGTEKCVVGAESVFEVYGMALHNNDDYHYIFINSNLPISGSLVPNQAQDSTVDFGDIFLHYMDFDNDATTLNAASGSENLWGVHITPDSDADIQVPGVFKQVTTHSVANENDGFISYGSYQNSFRSPTCNLGNEMNLGDAPIEYIESNRGTPTSIRRGTRIGEGCENIAYLVFNNQASINNPLYQTYENHIAGTSQALCGFQQGVMCNCVDNLSDPVIDEYLARKPSDWIGSFDVGVRINKSILERAQEKVRITITIECSNDIVSMDFDPTC
jgi:hypothetical protein